MSMLRENLNRRAKIVATLGLASSEVETISELILAGMNVARVNMGHRSYQENAQVISNIRVASGLVGLEVAILMDLQGPGIRVGKLTNGLSLKKGDIWVIGLTDLQNDYPEYKDCFIPTTYEHLIDDCKDGARILFDDGLIITHAVERDRAVYKIKVIEGGTLKSNNRINLPDSRITAPSLTLKDRKDLMFGLEHDVDYITLPFVRNKEDVLRLKELLQKHSEDISVVSKIETPEALENIEEILNVTDVIMVARGDIGVELDNQLAPDAQKSITSLCNNRGIPVITAAQISEATIENPVPTKIEASDIVNAVWDGTDAVMLSIETASGEHPVEAVRMTGKLISKAEKTPKENPSIDVIDLTNMNNATMITMIGASIIADKIDAKRILSVTNSGNSCLKMSRFRPKTSVLGISKSLSVVRKMCLYWGVNPFYLDELDLFEGLDTRMDNEYDVDKKLEHYIIEKVKSACELESGDKIVITSGNGKFFVRGSSNSIKIEII